MELSGRGANKNLGEEVEGKCKARLADAEDGGVAGADDGDAFAGAYAEFAQAFEVFVKVVNREDLKLAVEGCEG
jgi:hypothetical protein